MNILCLSLGEFESLKGGSVHIDVLKRLAQEQKVYVVCKRERKKNLNTELSTEYGINLLRVRTGNLKNVNLIEKGISTLRVENEFLNAIKEYFSEVKFDLILYSTPPITFVRPIEYIKKRDNAKSYLMLKDIFPQNAIDLGMLTKRGIKGLIYLYFRHKEKKLYRISDFIGCMSQANVEYVINHNPEINSSKVGIFPNTIIIKDMRIDNDTILSMRKKYSLPKDKKIFVYGGNLGKPQGIDFLIECLGTIAKLDNAFFLIIGNGTEYDKLKNAIKVLNSNNIKIMKSLPKEEYDKLVGACDVGLIFLDYRFTIPNFPARILSYMQAGLPILAATDTVTDVGKIIKKGRFGWWCKSNDVNAFVEEVNKIINSDLKIFSQNGWKYLNENYSVEISINEIVKFMDEKE